jgi:hypothetical protein
MSSADHLVAQAEAPSASFMGLAILRQCHDCGGAVVGVWRRVTDRPAR